MENVGGLLATLILSMVMLTTAACNTVEGAGQDLEAAGDAIEDSARDNRSY